MGLSDGVGQKGVLKGRALGRHLDRHVEAVHDVTQREPRVRTRLQVQLRGRAIEVIGSPR